jgi:hypothetical protein
MTMRITAASGLMATLIVTPGAAHADCGQDGQPACTGPVPTVDQVMDIVNELYDPNIPAANKGDIVTPPFTDDQAQKFDSALGYLRDSGVTPVNFSVTDIQPAPNNFAGATVSNPPAWHERHGGTGPVVLVLQNGRWMITHQSAASRLYRLVEDRTIHVGGI